MTDLPERHSAAVERQCRCARSSRSPTGWHGAPMASSRRVFRKPNAISGAGSSSVPDGPQYPTPAQPRREEGNMPTYRMVYGDNEQVVCETFHNVVLEREDGWTVLFRGPQAILRVRDDHIQSLEHVDDDQS
jgi:hypothetical protein